MGKNLFLRNTNLKKHRDKETWKEEMKDAQNESKERLQKMHG